MEKKQRLMLISVICVVLCVILTVVLILVLPKPEKPQDPKPWWEQRGRIQVLLEDERSLEKTYSYRTGDYIFAKFTYIEDKSDNIECIPKLRIFYDDVEIKVYTAIVTKIRYNENQDRYNNIDVVKGIGIYKVSINYYLTEEDAINNENYIGGTSIDITIKGANN